MRRALLLLPLALACGTSGGSGADAGLRDAAVVQDAGLLDAAIDPDAGFADAATPDAAMPDAGHLAPHAVLFLGNSYTYVNDLPTLYQEAVASLSPTPSPLTVDSVTAGGLRLPQHAANAADMTHRLAELLGSQGPSWTQVILQDQSQIPGFAPGQPELEASKAAAASLATLATARGASVVLFMTWGRRDGDSTNPQRFPDFATMQGHLEAGYQALAESARGAGAEVSIVPVGLAFAEVHAATAALGDPLDPAGLFFRLYAADGSHPSILGSYLATCVFVSSVLQVDATTITFTPPGVSSEDAVLLRAAAQATVDAT